VKTPLRYPGGKSRAVKTIMPYIRNLDCGELCSPFLGGGSIELKCAEEGMTVHGYDLFQPLVWFWQKLLADPAALVKEINKNRRNVSHYTPLDLWGNEWRKKCSGKCLLTKTSDTYCNHHKKLMKISRGEMLGVDEQLFKSFRHNANFTQHCDDTTRVSPQEILQQAVGYYIVKGVNRETLYGSDGDHHKGFDHVGLANILKSREKWVLSYSDCEYIRELYDGCEIVEVDWAYGMNKSKESSEILILG
jgi:DNA adenine methylase